MSVTFRPQTIPVMTDDPYSDENLRSPYALFERMRDVGPAAWLEKYQVLAFAGFQECKEILDDHRTFISRLNAGEPPTWWLEALDRF
ncbi:cytochrome P450 [Arthrobacter sp. V4I6]|uniref:hypothetical protein n=1 Tax=unclassified Arthrobacter TaxID=235627 RepID=UPI00278805A6|nr:MULTISPECIES: hypothetical protein [unclassified Arthrobacter]MDQ0821838.1 cytochrome P450 [Arthrobacter sp. V1I7]MDQ0856104.1 cytochrome P450 [Arthrobacter sp. V4I6]